MGVGCAQVMLLIDNNAMYYFHEPILFFKKNTVGMKVVEEPLAICLIDSMDMYHLVAAIPSNTCDETSGDTTYVSQSC